MTVIIESIWSKLTPAIPAEAATYLSAVANSDEDVAYCKSSLTNLSTTCSEYSASKLKPFNVDVNNSVDSAASIKPNLDNLVDDSSNFEASSVEKPCLLFYYF